jgi:hypothetical protein
VVAVTLQGADQGDPMTIHETLAEAGEAVAELIAREADQKPEAKPQVCVNGISEVVANKGYHSGATVMAAEQSGVRTYIPEPKRAQQRNWEGKAEEQWAVYGNRRRVSGHHGKRLLKKRGELKSGHLRTAMRPGDETNAPALAREHTEAPVDSCQRIQFKPDLPRNAGR